LGLSDVPKVSVTSEDNEVSLPQNNLPLLWCLLSLMHLTETQSYPCIASTHTKALHVWLGLYHNLFMQGTI